MKLPATLDEQLLKWKADDLSSASIVRKLATEHNIQVSESAVTKRITRLKEERAEAVGAKVLIKLEGKIGKDLDALDGVIQRALEDELRARQLAWNEDIEGKRVDYVAGMGPPPVQAGSEMWSRLMHVVGRSRADLMNALEKRLELAGAEGANKKPVEKEVKDRLMAKLDTLLDQASQKVGRNTNSAPAVPVPSTLQ